MLEEHFGPDVEWFPADQSLLAGETYRGYKIVRFRGFASPDGALEAAGQRE